MGNYVARYERINARFVYRVRLNHENQLFGRVQDLWYPPVPENINRLGRANYIGTPVFYCSDSENTAIIEQKINKPGHCYSVLKCERLDMQMFPVVFEIGVNDITAKLNPRLGGDRPDPEMAVAEFLNNGYDVRKYNLYQRFLITEFTKPVRPGEEYRYKISAVVANQVMGKVGVDGVCFPSVQSQFKGVNVAFSSTAIDRLYRAVECKVVRVTKIIGDRGYQIEITHHSRPIGKDLIIEWL
ncbi:MAG: RES domain-containing protein [Pyrinomonadaceae bacterium]|nr:RES domain-containing protein [Pyrinomonadaceae bacterium]